MNYADFNLGLIIDQLSNFDNRINKIENYMLGIKQEKEKENKENERGKIVIDVDFNFEPARKRLQEFAESIPRKDN